MNSEENMKKLLQAIHKPAVASSEFKEGLLKRLANEVSGELKEATIPLWRRPTFWMVVAGVLILIVIVYGIWLPQEKMAEATQLATSLISPLGATQHLF
jgi:Mn2+/Fe2+ NRAMP family transporter